MDVVVHWIELQNNLDVVSEFYDADVSGATIWKERRELDNAVAYCLENNINNRLNVIVLRAIALVKILMTPSTCYFRDKK